MENSKQEAQARLHHKRACPKLLQIFLVNFVADANPVHFDAGSPGASVALRLLKERADSAETRANSATRQVAELKASLQVKQALS